MPDGPVRTTVRPTARAVVRPSGLVATSVGDAGPSIATGRSSGGRRRPRHEPSRPSRQSRGCGRRLRIAPSQPCRRAPAGRGATCHPWPPRPARSDPCSRWRSCPPWGSNSTSVIALSCFMRPTSEPSRASRIAPKPPVCPSAMRRPPGPNATGTTRPEARPSRTSRAHVRASQTRSVRFAPVEAKNVPVRSKATDSAKPP